jgi:hypothetical protein
VPLGIAKAHRLQLAAAGQGALIALNLRSRGPAATSQFGPSAGQRTQAVSADKEATSSTGWVSPPRQADGKLNRIRTS